MPLQESATTPAALHALGREAHLIRTQGRITALREQVVKVTDAGVRDQLLSDLRLYERQLTEPVTDRTLQGRGEALPTPPAAASTTEVQALREELEILKQSLQPKEATPDGVLPVPQAAAKG